MIPFALVLATQTLDALALVLALPYGSEANPIMAAVLAGGGIGAVLAVKLAIGAGVAVAVARWHPRLAPVIGVMGCAGALTAVVAVVGA